MNMVLLYSQLMTMVMVTIEKLYVLGPKTTDLHCKYAQVATFCLFPLFKKSCAGASTNGN